MKRTAACLVAAWLTAIPAAAQDPLAQARALYEAAAFDNVLTALRDVTSADPAVLSAVHRYRALSLVAMRRDTEARQAINAMITADPMAPASLGAVPPRFRTMVIAAWRPIMRALVREQYGRGKSAYHAGASADAVTAFTLVIAAVHHPDLAFDQDPLLADVADLASEYLELSRSSRSAEAHAPSPLLTGARPCD
jgi:hypothetical protein